MLQEKSGLDIDTVKMLVGKDMDIRGISHSDLDKYFTNVLINIRKFTSSKKQKAGAGEQYKPAVTNLLKAKDGSFLFEFEDSLSKILKGFTIDVRIFHNLIRRMIMIKFNSDKIWTR